MSCAFNVVEVQCCEGSVLCRFSVVWVHGGSMLSSMLLRFNVEFNVVEVQCLAEEIQCPGGSVSCGFIVEEVQ